VEIVSSNGATVEFPPALRGPDIVVSCLSSSQVIAPGEIFKDFLPMGSEQEFARPGKYHIHITYNLVYVDVTDGKSHTVPFHAQFDLLVEKRPH